ncbi:MAG: NHL repeat-containing protein [Candidatus Marinimicrobia bacterium]|nr:NHL repeat-containing protein [Candidatus Neomarinimicrobiota bacterium]
MKHLLLFIILVTAVLAQPSAEIIHRFQAGMDRPTDIALLEDGRICVADGVNSRVLVFDQSGKHEVLRFAELKRPLGLAADLKGGLLITDTEANAVFILDKYLVLKAQLPLTPEIDATDVLPVGDRLWVVDNDGHQILILDRQGHIKNSIGHKGTVGPTFNYPSTISLGKERRIFVCDVLNGRIQLFNVDGSYRGQIADWGITQGSLYRPKGIAAHPAGPFVITDSFTGSIHFFKSQSSQGTVLTTGNSEYLRLENPLGLVWGTEDMLWVVESGTGDVLGIKIR